MSAFVNIDTCNKSKEFIKLTEIIENEKEEDTTVTTNNIKDYLIFTKLNKSPTFRFTKPNLLRNAKGMHNYTRYIHDRIKDCYEFYYKGNIKTVSAGVDFSDTPIYRTVETNYIET